MTQDRITRPQVKIGGRFSLVDHFGQSVTETSWPGQYLLIFFGFTHCKIVCPRALAKLERVVDTLGPDADMLRPLYVSVDPERDTPSRMQEFLAPYPHFLGLTGSREQVEGIKAAYRVFAQKQAEAGGEYEVPHSAITYLVAPDGQLAAHFVDALDGSTVAERIAGVISKASFGT